MVFITRLNGGTVPSLPRDARIYITGPHFGIDVYSGKATADEARRDSGLFTREEAERLLAEGKWSNGVPLIEEATSAAT